MLKAIIDTSSAILLYKTGIFEKIKTCYSLIISGGVFSELTCAGYEGADYFYTIDSKKDISIFSIGTDIFIDDKDSLKQLGTGEKESILLFSQGYGDFIILDDKKGASYCKKSEIPYVNAVLVVRILYEGKILSLSEYDMAFEKLSSIGRYSVKIIDYARNCDPLLLERFMPVK